MKNVFFLIIAILSYCSSIIAQEFAPLQKSPTDISYAKTDRRSKPEIKVVYSRPLKKNRELFGKLVKFDQVWRTGADEATEIKFFKDFKMGDKMIRKGTYSLFTIPNTNEWTIIINSDTDVWGAYNYDKSKDIARINVPVKKGKLLEAFSIAFKKTNNGYHMVMGWDTTRVEVPFYL